MNRIKLAALFIVGGLMICTLGLAQDAEETQKKKKTFDGARPDLPGVLGIDFGWVTADFPPEMNLNFWRSTTFSAYYKYDFYLGNSNFVIHTGFGITSENYSFWNDVSIASVPSIDGYQTVLVDLDSVLLPDADVKKSKLNPLYIDIPFEFTYTTNREIPKKAVKISFGGKIGFLIDSKTKVNFRQDGQKKVLKDKQNFDLSWYRINLMGRIEYASVGFFYSYSLDPLFEGDNGPMGTTAQPMSFGFSFALF